MNPIELNQEQRAAVDSDAPKRLVISGPGAGKTRVLVSAVAREAKEHGAEGCLVITFTNKAAREMESRLADMGVVGLGYCGTLHGFTLSLCRSHGGLVGLPESIGVMDGDQREGIVESIMKDNGCKKPFKSIESFLSDRKSTRLNSSH